MDKLQKEAADHGVTDCGAAMAFLVEEEAAPPAQLSLVAQLVELEMVLQNETELARRRAVLPLQSLLGNSGIHVFRKVTNAKAKAQSQEKQAKLRIQLDLLPGVPLEESRRLEGLKELQNYVLAGLRYQVEQQVFKRKKILAGLNGVESGKNAKKIYTRQQAVENTIRNLLNVIACWDIIDTDQEPDLVSDEAFKAVLTGIVPWRSAEIGTNGDEATRRHYGQLYRTELNQLKRTEEEEGILRVEAVRLVNGLERALVAIADAISQLQAELVPEEQLQGEEFQPEAERALQVDQDVHEPASQRHREDYSGSEEDVEPASSKAADPSHTAWPEAVIKGRIFMLKQEELKLKWILEDALKRLKASFPILSSQNAAGLSR